MGHTKDAEVRENRGPWESGVVPLVLEDISLLLLSSCKSSCNSLRTRLTPLSPRHGRARRLRSQFFTTSRNPSRPSTGGTFYLDVTVIHVFRGVGLGRAEETEFEAWRVREGESDDMVRLSYFHLLSHSHKCLTMAFARRPRLLRVPPLKEDQEEGEEGEKDKELEPHPDERQIKLDTDRSFVLYPVGDSSLLLHLAFRRSHNMICIPTKRPPHLYSIST